MLTAEWKKARKEFPDMTLHHLEAILNIRDDFKPKEIVEIIEDRYVYLLYITP